MSGTGGGPISAADMITRVFSNIDPDSVGRTNALFRAWDETVRRVRPYGERLAAHTGVIDLRNGVLTVETDHPGWSQVLMMSEDFIVRGMGWRVPDLGIRRIEVRLGRGGPSAGTGGAVGAPLDVRARPPVSEHGHCEAKQVEEDYSKNLPPDIMEKFENIRKSLQ